MNDPHAGKQFKSQSIVPVLVALVTLVLAGGIGLFWWPVGLAILFIGLFLAGLGFLGKKVTEEIDS